MSYILDAIRKSDQQRRRGEVPTLPTAPAAAAKRPAVMLYGLLGLVLVVVGMGIGWLSPWRPAPPLVAAVSGNQPESTPPRLESAQLPRMSAQAKAEMSSQEQPGAEAPALVAPAPRPQEPSSTRAEIDGAPSVAVSANRQKAAAVSPDRHADQDQVDGASEQKTGARSDLPLAIQQELPPMVVAMHVYSTEPRDRLVSVDNRLLREGDYLATDLKLEQIIADGMIFTYRGYRFRHGAK